MDAHNECLPAAAAARERLCRSAVYNSRNDYVMMARITKIENEDRAEPAKTAPK